MGVSNYNITAAAFQPARAQEYELSILAGMDSFAYILRDRAENVLLSYVSHTLTAEEQRDRPAAINRLVLADDKLRSLRYGSTILGWATDRATLVPTPLFDVDRRRSYLEHLTPLGFGDTVRADAYNEIGATLVYAAPATFLEGVERRLATRRTHHLAGGLLTAWGLRSRRLSHASVSLRVRGSHLFAAGHRSGQLLFFNTFPYTTAQDALYYLLLTYQQSGLSPQRAPLYLCGEIDASGDLYRQFYRYVEDIRFCQYPVMPKIPAELSTVGEHAYFELLCLG